VWQLKQNEWDNSSNTMHITETYEKPAHSMKSSNTAHVGMGSYCRSNTAHVGTGQLLPLQHRSCWDWAVIAAPTPLMLGLGSYCHSNTAHVGTGQLFYCCSNTAHVGTGQLLPERIFKINISTCVCEPSIRKHSNKKTVSNRIFLQSHHCYAY
jgi:hypothetical protein